MIDCWTKNCLMKHSAILNLHNFSEEQSGWMSIWQCFPVQKYQKAYFYKEDWHGLLNRPLILFDGLILSGFNIMNLSTVNEYIVQSIIVFFSRTISETDFYCWILNSICVTISRHSWVWLKNYNFFQIP